jgi:hypothetical protein
MKPGIFHDKWLGRFYMIRGAIFLKALLRCCAAALVRSGFAGVCHISESSG